MGLLSAGQLSGRHVTHCQAHGGQFFFHVRHGHHLGYSVGEPINDRFGRTHWRKNPVIRDVFKTPPNPIRQTLTHQA